MLQKRFARFAVAIVVASLASYPTPASGDVAPLRRPSQFAVGATTVDFEGMRGTQLTDEIPGLRFSGSELREDGEIGSSRGMVASAARSGVATVFTAWSEVRFDVPVVQVGAFVSPSFISVPLRADGQIFEQFRLKAYDIDGNPLGEVSVPVMIAVGPDEAHRIKDFEPVFIGLKSTRLIHSVVITRGGNSAGGGATMRYDDLTFTVAKRLN